MYPILNHDLCKASELPPVVQRADNFIHWIVRYPADKMCARFPDSPIIC